MRCLALVFCVGCFAEFPSGQLTDSGLVDLRADVSDDPGSTGLAPDWGDDESSDGGRDIYVPRRDFGPVKDGGQSVPLDIGASFDGPSFVADASDESGDAGPDAQLADVAELEPDGALVLDRGLPPDQGPPDPDMGLFDPGSPFTEIACGQEHCCAVRASGQVECWGNERDDRCEAPQGSRFRYVSAGKAHTCAVTRERRIECWGNNREGRLEAPNQPFDQVSGGDKVTCALQPDLVLNCWGQDSPVRRPPAVEVLDFALAPDFGCLVATSGELDCWGHHRAAYVPNGLYSSVAVGRYHACALSEDQVVACWGDDYYGSVFSDGRRGRAVTVGERFSCVLGFDDRLSCWGDVPVGMEGTLDDAEERLNARFVAISAGWNHVCGVLRDGEILCLGDDYHNQLAAPPVME